jgi:hypothetical protein
LKLLPRDSAKNIKEWLGSSKLFSQIVVLQEFSKWWFLGSHGKAIEGSPYICSQGLIAPKDQSRTSKKAITEKSSRKSLKEVRNEGFWRELDLKSWWAQVPRTQNHLRNTQEMWSIWRDELKNERWISSKSQGPKTTPKTLRTSDLYRLKITQATQIHKKSKVRDSRGDKRGEIHMNFLLIKPLWIHLYIKLDYVRTSSHSCKGKKDTF